MMNRICQILNIEKPIIQGPMVWLTDAKLVAAVSAAGGLGSLGPNAGQTTVTRDPNETAERMRDQIKRVRACTDKAFSVNILPAAPNTNDIYTQPMLKVVYEEHVPVVTYVGEVDEAIFKDLKGWGCKIVYRSLTPSAANARMAEKAGADIIVATGFDEGGSLPDKSLGTFSIVPLLVDAVEHTPIMACGGIVDNRGCKAAFALGAEGVYCGKAFLMSEESRMAESVKKAALAYDAQDLLFFRTHPFFYRALPGKLAKSLRSMHEAGESRAEIAKAMGGFAGLRIGMLEGDIDKGYVSLGNGISFIHEIKTAAQIINDITDGFELWQ